MRRTAGPRDDDLEAARGGALGIICHALRRAVRRDDSRFVGDAQRSQSVRCVAHCLPVGLAAHDNADEG